MILTDEEVDSRLNHPENLLNKVLPVKVLPIPRGGKTEGKTDMPVEIKKLLGSLANQGTDTQSEIAEAFETNQMQISNMKRGLAGGVRIDKELTASNKRVINKQEERVESAHELAMDGLMSSLGRLNPKLAEIEDPMKLAKVAGQLSKVASDLRPREKNENTANVQVVLMNVPQKEVSDYEVIEV
jgi:hypothetical protein